MTPEKITSITLEEVKTEELTHSLRAQINKDGGLQLEGQDLGKKVEQTWGEDEYEYWYTLPEDYKDTLLLLLIKDFFASEEGVTTEAKFKKYLEEHNLPCEFSNYV